MIAISLMQQFEFCEYQVYLKNIQNVEFEPSVQMKEGKEVHEQLYDKFSVKSKETSIKKMITRSKKVEVHSRELYVKSETKDIEGRIDEVIMSPRKFLIIEDKPKLKPGIKPWPSDKCQVYGYCLAFSDAISQIRTKDDNRPIVAALRNRDTQIICWKSLFGKNAQKLIISKIDRVHSVMNGDQSFLPTNDKYKCRGCNVRDHCDKRDT
jgi:CRISPR/Cas system-associated exonuclease Cas4 (RecB family)